MKPFSQKVRFTLHASRFRRGFTIVELLVGVAVFSLVIGGAFNLLLSSVSSQRDHLSSSKVFDQTIYLSEYMSRALRQAKKELTEAPSNCLTGAGRGFNYEVTGVGNSTIRFLDKDNLCREFSLSGTQIEERVSSDSTAANLGAAAALTSTDATVSVLRFELQGQGQEDSLQPRVTFSVVINGFTFQTSVSQRNFDVEQ